MIIILNDTTLKNLSTYFCKQNFVFAGKHHVAFNLGNTKNIAIKEATPGSVEMYFAICEYDPVKGVPDLEPDLSSCAGGNCKFLFTNSHFKAYIELYFCMTQIMFFYVQQGISFVLDNPPPPIQSMIFDLFLFSWTIFCPFSHKAMTS